MNLAKKSPRAGLLPALFFFPLLAAAFSCGGASTGTARPIAIAQVREAIRPHGKPLLVNHWATWCKPCVDELPDLAKLANRYAGRVDFLGVSWDGFTADVTAEQAREKVAKTIAKLSIPYDSLIPEGSAEKLGADLGLEELNVPQTFLFDREGKRAGVFPAIESEEDLEKIEAAIEKLLK